jgi:hypothetical protein
VAADGRLPQAGGRGTPTAPARENYWLASFDHAAWSRDSVLYEELIERVRAVEKGDERVADVLRQATADLQR